LPVGADAAYAWHAREGTLERLLPPWRNVRVVRRTGGLADGSQVELLLCVGPAPVAWVAEIRDCRPPEQFRDVQLRGPMAHWDHLHRFEPEGPGACTLEDRVEYALPAGLIGDTVDAAWVHGQLRRMFEYRHATTVADLAAHGRFADRPPLEIAVSGASGLIGSALAALLSSGGHRVRRMVRGEPNAQAGELRFRADSGQVDPAAFEGFDAVVHLAGENIAGRWTPERKRRIRASRVEGTAALCKILAGLERPPKVLVCASAIGIYGSREGELLDESSEPGHGFLADVCRDWEAAAAPVRDRGIRAVFARFGVVLSPRGGALAAMLTPFRLGLGGPIGCGRQYWSWITIDDAVGAIHHAIMTDSLDGPINVVSPGAVTNRDFAKTLGGVLRRPALIPMPSPVVRLAMGEAAEDLVLADVRVVPGRLEQSGYRFRHWSLGPALRHLLGRE
jgi:hypothetical protein